MIKIGIIGAGVIGTRLRNRFLQEDDVEITWICDVDPVKAGALAEETNAKITSDYNDLVNDINLDLVYIGVPPKWHKEIALKVLNTNINVICEKPIAMNNLEAIEMVQAEKNSNKLTCINLPFRWTPAVIEFKKRLGSGFVGEIKKIVLKFRFPQWPRSWQQVDWLKYRDQGGGLREVGTHFFFALGELSKWIGEVRKIWAMTEYPSDDLAEWNVNGVIEFTSGLSASIDYLVGSTEEEENSITIVGDKGILTLQKWSILLGSQNGEKLHELKVGREDEEDMVSAFLKSVRGYEPDHPLVSFESAAKAQQILQAIHESNGEWITLHKS